MSTDDEDLDISVIIDEKDQDETEVINEKEIREKITVDPTDNEDLNISIISKEKEKKNKDQDETEVINEKEIREKITVDPEEQIDYENVYIKKDIKCLSSDNVVKKKWFKQLDFIDKLNIKLIGIFFNNYNTLYLLCSSNEKNELYITCYQYQENDFFEFKLVANTSEKIYEAIVYEEAGETIKWCLLGESNIWKLDIFKKDLSNTENDLVLSIFNNSLFPPLYEQSYIGSRLIISNQCPWIIGGKIEKNGGDTSHRIIAISRSVKETVDLLEMSTHTKVINNFLTEKLEAPISYIYNDRLICIGGNYTNQENVANVFSIKDILSYDNTKNLIKNSSYNKDKTINAINSNPIQSATCLYQNAIFIFTDKIFTQETCIYYKYSLPCQDEINIGEANWQILSQNNYSPSDLAFSSAKATTINNTIFLFLFKNLEEKKSTTNIKIFKIEI